MQYFLGMMLVSLGASSLSREELKKLLGRMLKNKPLMGEPEKSKLTLSIIRHTTFPYQIGDLPMQACVRILKDGKIEYLIGCKTSEYEKARQTANDTTTAFKKNDTDRPYCHFFTKYEENPRENRSVNENVQYYQWSNQLVFHKYSEKESGFYGCYIGGGTRPWQWKHTGWTLFYSKPSQNLVDNTALSKETSTPASTTSPSPAPQFKSILNQVRRRGPGDLQKTEL